jgi:DNA-directed RNA polymerase specialized sigma24 family protein
MSGTGASESTSTDAALVSHSLVDPECFSLIVERHTTPIFRYLASRVDRSSSEDLLADVFEAAFRARHRYDTHYEDALPWLLGIATNVIRHHRRSGTRHASMVRRLTQLHGRSQAPSESVDAVAANAELNDQMHRVRRAWTPSMTSTARFSCSPLGWTSAMRISPVPSVSGSAPCVHAYLGGEEN